MNKILFLLPISLLISYKAHSMELPPTFASEGKQEDKSSLYLDEKAVTKFHENINSIIKNSLLSDEACESLFKELKQFRKENIQDAEVYWDLHQYATIEYAKSKLDIARKQESDSRIINAHLMVGYFKDFKARIAKEKQSQALQKKN